ncbi:unnamed protein product [Rangifer tarandus platyrhynchus]|uniref:Uncharacterized protein n=1 Tax=Rangifer tarandus platyrhynchus TaxID=3082113 RepID=A0AC59ZGM1_RANTA
MCVLSHFSHLRLFATLWAVAHQAPLSVEFSRQEHWSGLPHPPPGDLPNLGIKPESHVSCISRWVLYHTCHLGSLGSNLSLSYSRLGGLRVAATHFLGGEPWLGSTCIHLAQLKCLLIEAAGAM